MNITIKLDKSKRASNNQGHPVIVYITANYGEKKIRTEYRAKKNEWNEKLSEPTKKHSDYINLHRYITKLKSRINDVIYESTKKRLSIQDSVDMLFRKNSDRFYDLAKEGLPKFSTKMSALNSFNEFAPNIRMDELDMKLAKKYVAQRIKKHSPGGVDSYRRSLKALWNTLSTEPNPFKFPISIPDKEQRVATTKDLKKMKKAKLEGMAAFYRDCWLLMFYLGGIDLEVLARLKKDNIVGDRVNFNRSKGNSETFCSNIILPEAQKIIDKYMEDYFVPIHKYNYREFRSNFSRRFKEVCKKMALTAQLTPKNVRHTFIDRAQQLLIDERVTAQIVGHKIRTTTSIYTNEFPRSVQDEAHAKIIAL
ncbi:tyrosine-type recombinase/integrase [Flagellimonas sp. SN16]|uniref:tyrosine-type recombinase/integrase n=1 Tax=Flagellimonas sp. SN16 TaxID=3415142 RepID=UPI003C4ED5CE